jgi:beta-glucosidase
MVDAKAYSIMSAYSRVDVESAGASWLLLEDILHDKWGFEGYVVYACGAIKDIYANLKIVKTPEESAAIRIRKGCDFNCGGVYQNALKKGVELGFIDESEIYLYVLADAGKYETVDIRPHRYGSLSTNSF